MELRKLILLSLLALPFSLGAETASDYIHRGAQKYIFGHEAAAKAEIAEGLKKFPDDPELREMLTLFKQKPPQDQKDRDKNKKDDQDQSEKDSNKDQDKDRNNSPSPTPTPSPDQSKAQSGPEETPTPTPGSSPSEGDQPGVSPTPEEGMPSPTPSPGDENQQNQANADNHGERPSPNPSGTPSKPLTGEVKGAGEEKPQGTPAGEIAEAEPEKEGEMSPKQAAALLESMKDEEQKVQLDEHHRVLSVYKDW